MTVNKPVGVSCFLFKRVDVVLYLLVTDLAKPFFFIGKARIIITLIS